MVTESWLGVPIWSGDRVIGILILESTHQHAFTTRDERLLATIASSMGVALENARLFDETKRLLTETDERAAELAVINEIGRRLAASSRFRRSYELVGERLREIFDAQVDRHRDPRPGDGAHPLPVRLIERGVRFPDRAVPARHGPDLDASSTTRGHSLSTTATERAIEFGRRARSRAERRRVVARASDRRRRRHRRHLAPEPGRQFAFTDADVRVLTTLAASLSVALENARLFDETKRLLTETDERAAELAIINERPAGPRRRRSTCRRCTTSWATDPRDLRRPGRRHRHLRPRDGAHPLPVHDRAGRPVPGRADRAHRHPQARHRDARAAARSTSAATSGRIESTASRA